MYRKVQRQNYIILCIYIQSSFCVLYFVLLACRTNFVEFSCIMTRTFLDWFHLHMNALFNFWSYLAYNVFPPVSHTWIRLSFVLASVLWWVSSDALYSCFMQGKSKSDERSVVISLQDEERKYLSGNVIDGRNLFPAMGYLVSCRMHFLTNVVMGLHVLMWLFFILTSHIEEGL